MNKIPRDVPVLNDKPCGSCSNYDPIKTAIDAKGNQQYAAHGWCIPKSKYPFKEMDGQSFPANAKRVEEGERAKPCIVKKTDIEHGCALYRT